MSANLNAAIYTLTYLLRIEVAYLYTLPLSFLFGRRVD